jgi:uncharacterized DUF497 family protein
MEITWDEGKAKTNFDKHSVSFEEAATVLLDARALTFADERHSEERFITVGHSAAHKLLLVVWCERRKMIIRIISARKVTKRERRDYEEGI